MSKMIIELSQWIVAVGLFFLFCYTYSTHGAAKEFSKIIEKTYRIKIKTARWIFFIAGCIMIGVLVFKSR